MLSAMRDRDGERLGQGQVVRPAVHPEAPSQPTVTASPSGTFVVPRECCTVGSAGSIEAKWETEPITPALRYAVSQAG